MISGDSSFNQASLPIFIVSNWRQTSCLGFGVPGRNMSRAQRWFLPQRSYPRSQLRLASSNSGSPLVPTAHTLAHNFSIRLEVICFPTFMGSSSVSVFWVLCNTVLSNYTSMHVEWVVLEVHWRKVECQLALFTSLLQTAYCTYGPWVPLSASVSFC